MSESEGEDKMLMAKLASGDSSALDKLYRKHRQRVEACVSGNLPALSDFDVADIVQDVFRRVQQKAAQYKPTGKVLSWVLTIARNIVIDIVRQHYARRNRETGYAVACPPLGGDAERPEAVQWEYGDDPSEIGNGAAHTQIEELHTAQSGFIVLKREAGGQYTVWLGGYPKRRVKWGRNDKMRKWLQGGGQDSVRGMIRCLGLVPEDGLRKCS